MPTKQLLPNQHIPLHFIYGHDNCCLCKSNERIKELESELSELRKRKIPSVEEIEKRLYKECFWLIDLLVTNFGKKNTEHRLNLLAQAIHNLLEGRYAH